MIARFSLGIDLGTSNCAMALTDLDTGQTEVLPIPQIVAASQLAEKPMLASALYLPHPEEFRAGSFPLPWDDAGDQTRAQGIVGQFARDHGALVPDRLVTSAKSWLSNPHIDPKQRTLPWRSDSAEEKLSPFDCLPPLSAAPQGRLPPRRAGPWPPVGPGRDPATARSS